MANTTPLTQTEADKLDNSSPALQLAQAGERIKEAQADVQTLEESALIVQKVEITADASAGKSFTVTKGGTLIDVTLRATAASGSGTVTLRRSTTAISDAIVAAVDLTIGRAGTLSDLGVTLVAGETLNLITNGAADRAEVYLTILQASGA